MLLDHYIVIVLAAGLGKRLAPLTRIVPKPCLPLLGQPLCMGMVDQLLAAGADKIHINVSYLSDNLTQELSAALLERPLDATQRVRFWREPQRLETGGAILRIWRDLRREDPEKAATTKGVLVVSGDLVGDLPLDGMVEAWERSRGGADALLVYHETPPAWAPSVWVEGHGQGWGARILGFGSARPGPDSSMGTLHGADFANYQIISARALDQLSEEIRQVSSVDLIYRPLLSQGRPIAALELPAEALWHNVGTPAEYATCVQALMIRQRALSQQSSTEQSNSKTRTLLADRVAGQGLTEESLEGLPIQSLRTVPRLISLSEHETLPFSVALEEFARAIGQLSQVAWDRAQNKAAPLEGAGRLCLVIRVPLPSNSLLRAQRPLLVGAGDFLELALSQRLSREAPEDWAALLFEPSASRSAREMAP